MRKLCSVRFCTICNYRKHITNGARVVTAAETLSGNMKLYPKGNDDMLDWKSPLVSRFSSTRLKTSKHLEMFVPTTLQMLPANNCLFVVCVESHAFKFREKYWLCMPYLGYVIASAYEFPVILFDPVQ